MAIPERMASRRAEINFYRKLLQGFPAGGLIFDVGANQGDKADVFLKLGARVVAVEPNEYSRNVLAGKFLNFRLFKKPITLVGKAVGESKKIQEMWIDAPGSALNTFSDKWMQTLKDDPGRIGVPLGFGQGKQEKVEMTTLDDLIVGYGNPFFIKIDVEGYEINALRGLTRPVPFLSFEVNLPEFQAEGVECLKCLHEISRDGAFNYADDMGDGLALKQWLPLDDFIAEFNQYKGPGIEVFWKSK
jgi:FkbM family methyltransferase